MQDHFKHNLIVPCEEDENASLVFALWASAAQSCLSPVCVLSWGGHLCVCLKGLPVWSSLVEGKVSYLEYCCSRCCQSKWVLCSVSAVCVGGFESHWAAIPPWVVKRPQGYFGTGSIGETGHSNSLSEKLSQQGSLGILWRALRERECMDLQPGNLLWYSLKEHTSIKR